MSRRGTPWRATSPALGSNRPCRQPGDVEGVQEEGTVQIEQQGAEVVLTAALPLRGIVEWPLH